MARFIVSTAGRNLRPPSTIHLRLALLAATIAFVAGCGAQDHAHEQTEAGAHEEESRQLLLIGKTTECFVEYTPMAAGGSSSWHIHLTSETDGKPVVTPKVTLQLDFGRGTSTEVEARAERPGIYVASFPVPEPGMVRGLLHFEAGGTRDTVRFASLPAYASHEELHKVAHKNDADGILFPKEQAWEMDFRVAGVSQLKFPTIIKTTGHLLSHPDMEMEVPATAGGVLSFRGNPMLPGQMVRKGDVLATISGGALSGDNLEARIADARAVLDEARTDYERATLLFKEQVISQKKLQESTLRFERATNVLRTLETNVTEGGKTLRAPLSGYVKEVRVANGTYVREGDPILTVARNDRILLKAELYQSDYAQLASIHGATFHTDDGRTLDIRDLNGKLSTRGRAVDASAYSIPVYFEIDGKTLLPGEFVDVYLHSGEDTPRLVIPVSALTEELGVFSVYVQRGGERYEKRQIVIGNGDGASVPVLSGLTEGERIVTRGMHAIRLAASAGQVQAHAHQH